MATRFTPGPLTASEAAALNELQRVAGQFSRLSVAAPLNLRRAAGIPLIWLSQEVEETATSGSGSGSGGGTVSFTFVSDVVCDANGLTVTKKVAHIGFDGTTLTYHETDA